MNRMYLTYFIVIHFIEFWFCECFNSSDKLWTSSEHEFQSRSGRLLSFNTGDGNLRLDLQFTAPFIEIPLKKSLEMGKTALANVNIAGVIFAGITMLASALLIPTILLFFKNKFVDSFMYKSTNGCENQLRDKRSSEMWRYLTILDNTLVENNIDVTSCIQRSLCSTARKSAFSVKTGKGTSMEKIVDGIATNDWMLSLISETPLYTAIKTGRNDEDCFDIYQKCKVSLNGINFFAQKLVQLMNSFASNDVT